MISNDNDFVDQIFQRNREIGHRFRCFRRLLMLDPKDLGNDFIDDPNYINLLESGEILPGLFLVERLQREYALSLSWLLNGTGKIFMRKPPKEFNLSFRIDNSMDYQNPLFKEMVDMINNPCITDDRIIKTRLKEIIEIQDPENVTRNKKRPEVSAPHNLFAFLPYTMQGVKARNG